MDRAPSVAMISTTTGIVGSVQQVLLDTLAWTASRTRWVCYVGNVSTVTLEDTSPYIRALAELKFGCHQFVSGRRFSPRLVREIRLFLRNTRVDVAHGHGYRTDVHTLPAARLARVPFVSTIHTWTEHNWRDRVNSRIDQLILRYADLCIAVSEGMKRIAVQKGIPSAKIRVVHNWIDVSRIHQAVNQHPLSRDEMDISADQIVFLVPARLSPEKGHLYLLEALHEVVRDCSNVLCLFAGEGFYHPVLERRVQELSLERHVRFLGYRADVWSVMSLSDWIVLPSFKEGLPLALLEAMALCKPVIATNVSGVPEVVHDGKNGWLVPAGDSGALANRIREALCNPDIAPTFGQAGYELVTSEFSPDRQIPKIVQIYEELLAKREKK